MINGASNATQNLTQKTRNKGRISVSYREYLSYEVDLANEDNEQILIKLKEALLGGRPEYRGMLRLFISAIFVTGTRPVEVCNSTIMVLDVTRNFDNDNRYA